MFILTMIWWAGLVFAGALGFFTVLYFISKDVSSAGMTPQLIIAGVSLLVALFFVFSDQRPSYWLLCIALAALGGVFGWRDARGSA